MKCPNCGKEISTPNNYNDPPISMWGYFGYEILFALPFVGFILLIIFSVSGTCNKNLRNFARSYFCAMILLIIIVSILAASGAFGAAFGTALNSGR